MRALWFPGRPRPKERPRLGQSGRRGVVRVYTPRSTRHEEAELGWAWGTKHRQQEPLTGDVAATLVFVGGLGDIDNMTKLVLDALNGRDGSYDDDRQVMHLRVWRLPAGCGVANGTYIRLRPLPAHWRRRVAGWLKRVTGVEHAA